MRLNTANSTKGVSTASTKLVLPRLLNTASRKNIVMSDSEDSAVTYTTAPPSPDYVPGLEEPEQAPLLLEFVSEHVYPKFMPPKDKVSPAKEQPLPTAVSPTADSPGYIADSDPKEDEEDPEEDPIDYPADEGDDDDDDDESFDDDEDDDDDVEEDEDEEEEEHPAPADSVPPPIHRVTTRMSIRDEPPTPFWSEAEIARLLAIPSPPPSPLSPWSSPLPQIPSPPLPVSSPVPVSPPPLLVSRTYLLGFRAAMIWQRAESPSTSHSLPLPPPIILSYTRASVAMMRAAAPSTYILASRSERPPSGTPPLLPIPLPTPSPPLLLPFTDGRANTPEVCLPPRKRLCIALGPRYEVYESSSAPTARPTGGFRADYGFVATLDDEIRRDPERDVSYGITDTWDEMLVDMPGAPATDDSELGQWMTNFVTTVRQDTDKIYGRLDDVQDDRSLMSGWLNMLFRDRRAHARTALLMEREARLSREAWGQSMDASDTARSEVRALRTTILAQHMKITALRVADCARQAQLVETLRLMSTLQTQMTALQGQQGPARGPTQPKIPEEASSSS
ncbi:hypothetical protein Tco_1407181 [Tanacetum coccineum]